MLECKVILTLIQEAVRSKAYVCSCLMAGIAGSNPAGVWVSCVMFVVCLCNKLITCPEESYQAHASVCV